jgi:hypothetical protein
VFGICQVQPAIIHESSVATGVLEKGKSRTAKDVGEYGGCGTTVMPLVASFCDFRFCFHSGNQAQTLQQFVACSGIPTKCCGMF